MAKSLGYETTLVFFWLNSVDLAVERVKVRVREGGHDIPIDTITRRYHRGLSNFFKLYKNAVDHWMFINSSGSTYQQIAQGSKENEIISEETNGTKSNMIMKNQTFEEESKLIFKGLEIVHEKLVKFKKAKGTPLVLSDNGKIRHVPAKDLYVKTTDTK